MGVGPDDAVALIARNDFVCLETSLATQAMKGVEFNVCFVSRTYG